MIIKQYREIKDAMTMDEKDSRKWCKEIRKDAGIKGEEKTFEVTERFYLSNSTVHDMLYRDIKNPNRGYGTLLWYCAALQGKFEKSVKLFLSNDRSLDLVSEVVEKYLRILYMLPYLSQDDEERAREIVEYLNS